MTKAELLKAMAAKRAVAGGKSCWMSVDGEASLYVHITPLGQDRFYFRTKKIARRIGKVSVCRICGGQFTVVSRYFPINLARAHQRQSPRTGGSEDARCSASQQVTNG